MMPRERAAATLLVTGTLAGMLVMVLHPTGADIVNAQNFARHALLNQSVHGIAIASLPMLFLGFAGLCRRLAWTEVAIAGLVSYGFAAIAVMAAAVASGFIFTGLIEQLLAADEASRPVLRALMRYTHQWNQAFAAVHVVAASAAILMWSIAIMKDNAMPRALGYAGAAIGAVIPWNLRLPIGFPAGPSDSRQASRDGPWRDPVPRALHSGKRRRASPEPLRIPAPKAQQILKRLHLELGDLLRLAKPIVGRAVRPTGPLVPKAIIALYFQALRGSAFSCSWRNRAPVRIA